MINDDINPINIIEEANSKTLDYFNKAYVSSLELVQSLKTELFELDIQIETLEKTREIYTYHIDTRRNLLSPLSPENERTQSRGYQISLQIKDLKERRQNLCNQITDAEQNIVFYKEQVSMLSKANRYIHTSFINNCTETYEEDADLDSGIEFIEEEDTTYKTEHHYASLMLQDYEHFQHASELDQKVRQELVANLNKLDSLKWLLHTDIGRAKITLDELLSSQQHILCSVERILQNLDYPIDRKQPVWNQINQLIENYQKEHPECLIQVSCDYTEDELNIPSFISIRLVRMIQEIFDNIFAHSNADKVTGKISINSRLIDVQINDNGVGIPEDYLERSDWCSGLHKLHETIYQLDGNLQIRGDLISGTDIRFSFPIMN